jgi:CTD small phosphatase-like protein 2
MGALFSPALHLDEDDSVNDSTNTTPSVGPEEDNDEYYTNGDDDFNPYYFISGLPHHASVAVRGKICLPQKSPHVFPITLTLDLDETLVHCSVEPIPNPDIVFPVNFNGTAYQVYVRKRPYLDHFLETVSKQFEIVIFTASQKVYADTLLGKVFKFD